MSTTIQTDTPPATLAERRRVLVVDDDPVLLRTMGRQLRRVEELDVILVDSGIDALIRIGSMIPDLVVMDVFMPGLDGIEACRRLKANPSTRDVKVVLATGSMSADVEASALSAGADHVMPKPFDVSALLRRFRAPAAPPKIDETVRPTERAADLLVEMLEDAGVEYVFGIPGGAISPVHDALLDSSIRTITTRHESGAMFAAAGYAHGTGRLGVVAVTSGPGVLNAMTGLASAWCDGLPVMLLVGEVPRRSHGKGVLQDGSAYGLHIVEMASYITKLAVEVPDASQLPHLLRRAMATALSGKRGPVVLTLPMDVMTAQIVRPRIAGSMTMGGSVPNDVLDEVGGLLAGAVRPLILAGSGTRTGEAPSRLLTVAERLRCPVATTPKAKGVFPENHPLSLGVVGLAGHPSAQRYLDGGVDVLVAIGTSLGDLSTNGFDRKLQAPRAMIHVDIDARQVGKSYAPTHAVVAAASDFLGGLARQIGEAPVVVSRPPRAGVERNRLLSSTSPAQIASHDALADIQRVLPADTIYTVDSGDHFLFATHFLEITHPDGFVVMTGLGSMGQSIGAAIGASLAHPGRSVAAICGDGCFAMNAFEVATAVAERLPIRVFVFNDQRLGMVENGHESVYGRRPEYPTAPMDVCAVARGLGAATIRIDQVGQLEKHAELFSAQPGPIVVDVRIDHTVKLPKKDRIKAFSDDTGPNGKPRRQRRPSYLKLVP
jgi:acetolactate synthase-1/2/3 large subunit